MKKILIPLICIIIGFSCSDDIDRQVNGQWQLKTIDENGIISSVDTIYFSFQRGVIFSFTHLRNPDEATISYGYVDYPSDHEIKISMDTTRNEPGGYFTIITKEDLYPFGWNESNGFQQIFNVESIDEKNMVLSQEQVIYSFRKF